MNNPIEFGDYSKATFSKFHVSLIILASHEN